MTDNKLMSSIFQVPTMAIEKVHMYNNTSIIQDEVCACAVCNRADVATTVLTVYLDRFLLIDWASFLSKLIHASLKCCHHVRV